MGESNDDRQSLKDDAHPGRPVTVATSEMVNKVHDIGTCIADRDLLRDI